MSPEAEALHLVYDADTGAVAAALDSAKKLLGLDACPLCAITHGLATERRTWRDCKRALGVPIFAWHRDAMPEGVCRAAGGALPAVVVEVAGAFLPLVGPDDIRSCARSPERLAAFIRESLMAHGLSRR